MENDDPQLLSSSEDFTMKDMVELAFKRLDGHDDDIQELRSEQDKQSGEQGYKRFITPIVVTLLTSTLWGLLNYFRPS